MGRWLTIIVLEFREHGGITNLDIPKAGGGGEVTVKYGSHPW